MNTIFACFVYRDATFSTIIHICSRRLPQIVAATTSPSSPLAAAIALLFSPCFFSTRHKPKAATASPLPPIRSSKQATTQPVPPPSLTLPCNFLFLLPSCSSRTVAQQQPNPSQFLSSIPSSPPHKSRQAPEPPPYRQASSELCPCLGVARRLWATLAWSCAAMQAADYAGGMMMRASVASGRRRQAAAHMDNG